MTATVTVRGEASVRGEPDEATIAIELSAVRATPQEAYADVADRSQAVTRLLDELEIEPARRSTAGVSLQPQVEYDTNGRPQERGHRASNHVVVRLDDPDLLGPLIHAAVERAAARVKGPWWEIAQTNPIRQVACREAAADARRRAEAYADGLGATLGVVISAVEPETVGRPAPVHRAPIRAFASTEGNAEIPFEPGDLRVWAAVDVTFALEQR